MEFEDKEKQQWRYSDPKLGSVELILKQCLKDKVKKITPKGSKPQKFCLLTLFERLTLMVADKIQQTKIVLTTCKGHDTVVSLSAGDETRPAEA